MNPDAEVNLELLFEGVLKDMELTSKKCLVSNQGGGAGPEISIEDITVLIILFHGRTELTQAVVDSGTEHLLKTINVSSFKNVNNLAYLALAPTGQVNMGTFEELKNWCDFLKNVMMQHIIDAINGKFGELITNTPTSEPDTETESILSRICKYCFELLPSTVLSLQTYLPDLNRLFSNFKFTGNFMVCRTVEPAVSAVSAVYTSVHRTKDTVHRHSPRYTLHHQYFNPPSKSSVSMNFEMFLLLLESLRISIKKIDISRFPSVCKLNPKPWDDYCKCAYNSRGQRCRNLAILKGFGVKMEDHIPFINKDLAYDRGSASSYGDTLLGMGVMKLNFTTDSSGKVICNSEFFTPDMVTHGVRAKVKDTSTTSWFNMQECINFCTSRENAKNSKTVLVLDMSCSSNSDKFKTVTTKSKSKVDTMGGGKQIKKKSGSMKKTRRIKNKSKSTRYIRNRRNRLKHNKRTKKGRKTKTYRKH